MAKSDAQRKRDQRERDTQHLIDVGAKEHKIMFYRATLEHFEFLKVAGDFEQIDEVITLLIHNASQAIKRDISQINELLKVPCHTSRELSND